MSLNTLLSKFKAPDKEYTHTSLMPPCMTLLVTDEDLPSFQEAYVEEFIKGTPLGIVEKHREVSPVLIDLDFKLDKDEKDGEHYFDTNKAMIFMDGVLRVMDRYLYLPDTITYYILTKPTRMSKNGNQKKYGMHIIIPDVITEPFYQFQTRKVFIEENPGFFDDYPFENSIEDIYDEAVIERNAWLMYGSKKQDDTVPWKVKTRVSVDRTMNFNRSHILLDDNSQNDPSFVKKFSIRDEKLQHITKITQYGLEAIENKTIPNIPKESTDVTVLRSKIDPIKHHSKKKQGTFCQDTDDGLDNCSSISQSFDLYEKDDNVSMFSTTSLSRSNYRSDFLVDHEERCMMQEFVRECVDSLADYRSDQYHDWIRVCWCLRNIVGDHYKTWIDFSKRSSKFDQSACDTVWSKGREDDGALHMGSLLSWVKKDNSDEDYDIIILKKKKIENMLQAYDKPYSIAKVIRLKYNGLYLHGKKQWYAYVKENHRWELMNSHYPLREKITNEIHDEYADFVLKVSLNILMWQKRIDEYQTEYGKMIKFREDEDTSEPKNESTKESQDIKTDTSQETNKNKTNEAPIIVKKNPPNPYKMIIDRYSRLILEAKERLKIYKKTVNRLYESSFKNNVMNELEEIFDDKHGFIKRFDDNKALIGFKNGVYDLEKLEFRDGSPADLITFSTGYEYDANEDVDIQKEIVAFMSSIMRDEEYVKYMFKILAYMLHGNKYLEDFFFLTGSGRNGKGTLVALLNKTFGDYYFEPSIETFTTAKYTADSASPELKKFKGKRLIVSSEPDETDSRLKFRANQLKRFRGNDMITTRGLYEDTTSFLPQFGMCFAMNAIPEISKADSAIADTLKIIGFPFKFTHNPTMPHERKGDPSIKHKLTSNVKYAQQMMLILLKEYKEHIHGFKHIITPYEVTKLSREYVEENSPIVAWFEANIEITSDESKTISAISLWEMFKLDTGINISPVMFGREIFQIVNKKSKVVNKIRSYCGLIVKPASNDRPLRDFRDDDDS